MQISKFIGISATCAVFLSLFFGCNTTKPFYESGDIPSRKPDGKQVDYSLFLIGDTGAPHREGAKQVLQTLNYQLQQAGDSSSIVFLGDNIYPNGMPPPDHESRGASEHNLKPALNILKGYKGVSFFIPGNHDWLHGLEGVQEQEQFIEQYPEITTRFTPDNGCPGPETYSLSKKWQLIVLDSEWWVTQSFDSELQAEGCSQQSRSDVMKKMTDLVDQYDDKNIVVAFHHTLYSNGTHGGYYSLKDHLFPLTNLSDYAFLPLPLIGSLYPVVRQVGKYSQDQLNEGYQEFKRQLLQATEDKEHVFFAGGHEHSLSFYEKDKANIAKEGQDFFILSGSGSKKSYARKGYGAQFVYSHKGFAKLISYTDGSVAVEFWVPDEKRPEGQLVYRKKLLSANTVMNVEKEKREPVGHQRDSVKVAAGPGYEAGGAKRFIWGDHYRDAWTKPIEIPVLDLDTEKGGLNIITKTGGVQTITIIAEDPTGRKYVMRSVQKNPTKSLPEELQQTFITDVAQDQTSATHPYGGLVAAALASAAGVYHTTPELRYIAGESAFDLDISNREGTLVTMEEFVSTEWFNTTYNQKAKDMVGTGELWDRLRSGKATTIDERQLVRSRLFDMYIGDWDRHEKQWFWAETPTDTTAVYKPIPIDRDNAFYRSDGVMLGLARRLLLPKFQNFGDDIDNIKGINLNAQHFDRWFINQLSREEWLSIARELQQSITDSAITQAVDQWPESIRALNGQIFIKKLKARRERLPDFARRYYDLLMRNVNVYGSQKSEEFVVKRQPNGKTVVSVYKKEDSGDRKISYHRTFNANETHEVRLYGFDGDDDFNIKGKGDDSLTIRIIGGVGEDKVADWSSVAALGKKTLVYDTKKGIHIEGERNIKDKTSTDPGVNRFEKRAFQYDFIGPLISTGYNESDGIFLGGGIVIRKEGFRKEPFAQQHRIKGKTPTGAKAFSASYNGIFTEAAGQYNVEIKAEVEAPNNSEKFFGLGNGTEKERGDSSFYTYRMDNVNVEVALAETMANLLNIRASLGTEYYKTFAVDNRFITSPEAALNENVFGAFYYATAGAGFTVNSTDSNINPSYGARFDFQTELKVGLSDRSTTFGRIGSEGIIYYTFRNITTTLASRVGFATNVGNYNFYQAHTLGGQSFSSSSGNLRGFLRDRFAGRTSLFHNTEIRTKLFDIKSYFLPGTMGILAFVDEGRVWAGRKKSTEWHVGYGGGLWISPLNSIVFTGGLSFSKEETLLTLTLGFPF